jgi:hypothetical protein
MTRLPVFYILPSSNFRPAIYSELYATEACHPAHQRHAINSVHTQVRVGRKNAGKIAKKIQGASALGMDPQGGKHLRPKTCSGSDARYAIQALR